MFILWIRNGNPEQKNNCHKFILLVTGGVINGNESADYVASWPGFKESLSFYVSVYSSIKWGK